MRILCIFFHPEPFITALGGAEKRFLEVSSIWKKLGISIVAIEPGPQLSSEFILYPKKHQAQFRGRSEGSWIEIYLKWIKWTLYACIRGIFIAKRQRPNLVLATNNTAPNLIPAYLISKICRLPLCVIVHHIDILPSNIFIKPINTYTMYRKIDYDKLTSLIKTLALLFIMLILKRSNICIAVSHSTANVLLHNGVPSEKIYVSGNGVNVDYIDSFKFYGQKKYDGVFVGRISKEKGVFSLLYAWQKIKEIKPCAKLAVIGSGVELPKIKETITKYHLKDNVVLLGARSDKEMYNIIKASKVFVFPSLLEGWGLAIAEALACGLPVVCYDIPAIREIFGKCKSVFRVPAGDKDKLASKILEVLQMNLDELNTISKTYVKHFDWNKIALMDFEIVKRVIDSDF